MVPSEGSFPTGQGALVHGFGLVEAVLGLEEDGEGVDDAHGGGVVRADGGEVAYQGALELGLSFGLGGWEGGKVRIRQSCEEWVSMERQGSRGKGT